VLAITLLQHGAHDQSGLAASNDDCVVLLSHMRPAHEAPESNRSVLGHGLRWPVIWHPRNMSTASRKQRTPSHINPTNRGGGSYLSVVLLTFSL
jgi:hypothetical protein